MKAKRISIMPIIIILLFSMSIHLNTLAQINFTRVEIDNYGPKDPFGKSIGDIDGDGFIDLVEGGYEGGGLVWYKNPENPFAKWEKFIIEEGKDFTTDHQVVDIDLDGKLDLVALNLTSVIWYRNDGTPCDGTWKKTIIEKRALHDIEVGDFDEDGDIDVVGRYQDEWVHGGQILHFYEQVTPQNWKYTSLPCPQGEGLLKIDLDNDGKEDLVTGNKWYKNNASMDGANWTENTLSESWKEINVFIAAGDLNNDGLSDLVFVPSEPVKNKYHISWLEHPKNHYDEWTEHLIEDSVQSDFHFVGCGDFDLDGEIDIVAAEMHHGNNPDEVSIYKNNGNGSLWKKDILWDGGSHSCRVFDCDNDGDLDFFGANYRGTQVNLWVNHTIKPSPISIDNWTYIQIDSLRDQRAMGLTFCDINGDGETDIASGKWVYIKENEDLSKAWKRLELPLNVDVLLNVNVDDDNRADLIAEDGDGQMYWFEMVDDKGEEWYYRIIGNAGKGNHALSSQGYILAQLKAGGKPEIVILGGEQPNGAIYSFEIPKNPTTDDWNRTVVSSSVYPDGLSSGDFDGDGDIDLCAPANTNNQVAWYENPGNPQENWNSHIVGLLEGPDRFSAADMDGDGRTDIVVSGANRNENGVYWFKQPKKNAFDNWKRMTVVNSGSKNSMNSLDVADMDLDGDIDIISGTHRDNLEVVIWENNGKARFTKLVVGTGKESHLGARVTDIDGDGNLDILSIAWDKSQYLHLWRNDAITKIIK